MTDPWADKPVPLAASDRERMDNAILHLGRVLGGVMLLRAFAFTDRERESLDEIENAAKRAATWLGVTLWQDEEASDG